MATITAIAAALKTALATVTTVRAYSEQPDTVAPTQGKAVVFPVCREIVYHETFAETEVSTWDVVILAAPESAGYTRGQQAIDPYISKSGSSSLKAAIESDGTLGGVVHTLVVPRAYDRGLIEVNGVSYFGAKLEVQVYE